MIPAPNAIGELPPGMHTATLEEIEAVFVTTPRRRLVEDSGARSRTSTPWGSAASSLTAVS